MTEKYQIGGPEYYSANPIQIADLTQNSDKAYLHMLHQKDLLYASTLLCLETLLELIVRQSLLQLVLCIVI